MSNACLTAKAGKMSEVSCNPESQDPEKRVAHSKMTTHHHHSLMFFCHRIARITRIENS
jgi:hypothetical protein